MNTLITILLVIIAIIIIIGIIRVIFSPYEGFTNCLMEIMLLDYMGDILGGIFEAIGDIGSDSDW